jgi:hypothetical protein
MMLRTLIDTASSRTRAVLTLAAIALVAAALVGCALLGALPAAIPAAASPAATAASVDDWQHEWEVLRLVGYLQEQAPPPPGPMVYDLGDSITRESITGDTRWTSQLQAKAARAQKVLPRAWVVAGHNQTFGMDEQLVEGLPATPDGQPKGIVLIGVGISRFIGPPLGEKKPSITPATPGVRPGFSPWQRHLYDGRPPLSLTRKKELVPRWMERRWAGFQANRAANFAAITRIIKACAAKGLRPVLLDQPLDMKIVGSGLDKPRLSIRSGCDTLVSRYGKQYGVRYLHFTRSVAIPTRDYWDMHHLFDPGARIWQTRLSDELVKILPAQTL